MPGDESKMPIGGDARADRAGTPTGDPTGPRGPRDWRGTYRPGGWGGEGRGWWSGFHRAHYGLVGVACLGLALVLFRWRFLA